MSLKIVDITAAVKLNLNLQVLGRKPNGYHIVSGLFVFTDFGDKLSFVQSDTFSLTIKGEFAAALGNPQDTLPNNSIYLAAKALSDAAGVSCSADVVLDKKIPVAAGCGGGTADAAATLKGLMKLWDVELADEKLQRILPTLGSDVPACYVSKSVMVGGCGEVIRPAPVLPHNIPVLLINPRKLVPTKRVFDLCAENPDCYSKKVFVFKDAYENIKELAEDLRKTGNDLAAAAEKICPEITTILRVLQTKGCLYASVSGSGATCFALFEAESDLHKAAVEIRESYPQWWLCETFIP